MGHKCYCHKKHRGTKDFFSGVFCYIQMFNSNFYTKIKYCGSFFTKTNKQITCFENKHFQYQLQGTYRYTNMKQNKIGDALKNGGFLVFFTNIPRTSISPSADDLHHFLPPHSKIRKCHLLWWLPDAFQSVGRMKLMNPLLTTGLS